MWINGKKVCFDDSLTNKIEKYFVEMVQATGNGYLDSICVISSDNGNKNIKTDKYVKEFWDLFNLIFLDIKDELLMGDEIEILEKTQILIFLGHMMERTIIGCPHICIDTLIKSAYEDMKFECRTNEDRKVANFCVAFHNGLIKGNCLKKEKDCYAFTYDSSLGDKFTYKFKNGAVIELIEKNDKVPILLGDEMGEFEDRIEQFKERVITRFKDFGGINYYYSLCAFGANVEDDDKIIITNEFSDEYWSIINDFISKSIKYFLQVDDCNLAGCYEFGIFVNFLDFVIKNTVIDYSSDRKFIALYNKARINEITMEDDNLDIHDYKDTKYLPDYQNMDWTCKTSDDREMSQFSYVLKYFILKEKRLYKDGDSYKFSYTTPKGVEYIYKFKDGKVRKVS